MTTAACGERCMGSCSFLDVRLGHRLGNRDHPCFTQGRQNTYAIVYRLGLGFAVRSREARQGKIVDGGQVCAKFWRCRVIEREKQLADDRIGAAYKLSPASVLA